MIKLRTVFGQLWWCPVYGGLLLYTTLVLTPICCPAWSSGPGPRRSCSTPVLLRTCGTPSSQVLDSQPAGTSSLSQQGLSTTMSSNPKVDSEVDLEVDVVSLGSIDVSLLVTEILDRKLETHHQCVLAFKVGSSIREEMFEDARRFVGAQIPTAEDSDPVKFIENDQRCEPFTKFLEGVTNKSFGTMPVFKSENNKIKFVPESTKIRQYNLASKCYESALKLCIPNSLPPVSLKLKMDMNTKIGSKAANVADVLGGSYDTQRLLKCNLPIPKCTENHIIILDNAQKGRGKYQKKQRLKLDQKASISVHTNIIAAVPEKFLNSDIFKVTSNLPSTFEEHPLFNPKTDNDFP